MQGIQGLQESMGSYPATRSMKNHAYDNLDNSTERREVEGIQSWIVWVERGERGRS